MTRKQANGILKIIHKQANLMAKNTWKEAQSLRGKRKLKELGILLEPSERQNLKDWEHVL